MTTAEFIIALFYRIDNPMHGMPKHPQAALHPTLACCMCSKAGPSPPYLCRLLPTNGIV